MDDVEVQVVIAKLTQAVESGFAAMDRRMVEFSARMSEMEKLQRIANGSLSRHEVQIETMETEIERQRKNAHDLRSTVQALMPLSDIIRDVNKRMNDHPQAVYPPPDKDATDGDNRRITERDVRMFLFGGGALVVVWKFLEWVGPHLKGLS